MALLTLVLFGAGAGALALASAGGGGKPSKGGPKRIAVPDVPAKPWSAPQTEMRTIDAPGWYADVLTRRDGSGENYCGDGRAEKFVGTHVCDDGGRWTPVPERFELPLVRIDADRVVTVDVEIVDVDGIVARTKYRRTKSTSGRRRGSLDVNEYELVGPARDTSYCERLTRRFSVAAAGGYMERVELDCETDATPRQPYTLYRAQRDTSLSPPANKSSEWFAKIRPGSAYSGTGLYALQLKMVGGWATLTGEIAASLAPQRVQVVATFRTRRP